MRTFRTCVWKNFKNLFRNWASIFLVIIGPLLLIGIIFLAFSDIGFGNVKIGYVVDGPEEFQPFLDSIYYVGQFQQYSSIEECDEQLKLQNIHACLDVKTPGETIEIAVRVDNTRELISYIIYGQISRAVVKERQKLVLGTIQKSMTKLVDVNDFIEETQSAIRETVTELDRQKKQLFDTKNELFNARKKLEEKKTKLYSLRNELQQKKFQIQAASEQTYNNAMQAINEARNTVSTIYNEAASVGVPLSTSISYVHEVLNQQQNQIVSAKQTLDLELQRLEEIIQEIDNTIQELNEAAVFIDKTDRRLDDTIIQIEREKERLSQFLSAMDTYQAEISEITSKDAKAYATPIETTLSPTFTGSERMKKIELGLSLTEEQKARLLNFGSIQTLLPFILAILICFISIILANIVTLDEIHSPAFTRNTLSPTSPITRIAALFFTIFAVSFVQVAIILGIGYGVFVLDIFQNLTSILIPLLLLIAIYAIIGMITAYLINEESTSLLVSSFIMIITLFLSGAVYPVERMSNFMEYIAKAIPFTSGISMLQKSIFYGIGIGQQMLQVLTLTLMLAVLIVFLIIAYQIFLGRRMRTG